MPARTVGRIQTRAAFGQLQRSRARASCGPVRASFVPGRHRTCQGVYPQVGYAIGKHCGNAVVRNSLRRRMRESARVDRPHPAPGAYLLRVEPAAATTRPRRLRRRRATRPSSGPAASAAGTAVTSDNGPSRPVRAAVRVIGRTRQRPRAGSPPAASTRAAPTTPSRPSLSTGSGRASPSRPGAWSVAGPSGRTGLIWCPSTSTPTTSAVG